jgi:hypothetical protein
MSTHDPQPPCHVVGHAGSGGWAKPFIRTSGCWPCTNCVPQNQANYVFIPMTFPFCSCKVLGKMPHSMVVPNPAQRQAQHWEPSTRLSTESPASDSVLRAQHQTQRWKPSARLSTESLALRAAESLLPRAQRQAQYRESGAESSALIAQHWEPSAETSEGQKFNLAKYIVSSTRYEYSIQYVVSYDTINCFQQEI